MANPRHNTQTTNRRGAMGGGMMKKRPGYSSGKKVVAPITHAKNIISAKKFKNKQKGKK
jgi:hypothetical protein